MEDVKLYDEDNCPCTSECPRHGICPECIEAHHGNESLTFCERVYKEGHPDFVPEESPLDSN